MSERLADLGASWRMTLLERLWAKCPFLWEAAYNHDARFMLDQALSRMLTAMTEDGRASVANLRYDGEVRIQRVPVDRIEGRGDFRYRSDNLVSWMRANPDMDLVPIVCVRTRMGYRVMDGHHRVRAYEAVGRMPLAAVVIVRPGSGLVTV